MFHPVDLLVAGHPLGLGVGVLGPERRVLLAQLLGLRREVPAALLAALASLGTASLLALLALVPSLLVAMLSASLLMTPVSLLVALLLWGLLLGRGLLDLPAVLPALLGRL